MRYFDAQIAENNTLGNGYFRLRLADCAALATSRPGQFIMVRGDWGRDPLLPRPMSLMSTDPNGHATMLARAVGRGTRLLAQAPVGTRLSVLGPLGNGFPDPAADTRDLLVAGGVGMPPLFMQATHAARLGLVDRCEMLYGGRSKDDLLFVADMDALGLATFLVTEDGGVGRKGRVTTELEARIEHNLEANPERKLRILACGPREMLWAVARIAEARRIECHLSMEEQMACGIGVCLGCALPARTKPFRYTCNEGPVFLASELVIPPAPGASKEVTP